MAPPAPPTEDPQNGQSSAAVTNGPVDSGGTRSWERSWTVDEMRQDAGNWSLAGDAGLLLHLKDFSQRMTTRVHEIEKEVDGLLHEAKLTSVRANNVFNDFIMLANTQFVENRVYDEDVSQEEGAKEDTKPEDQEKTREQRESELIPKVKEALALGINVIDQAFEKLDSHVADSDSEDDDDTGYRVDPILEAKDPYLSRPLPLLIGTPNFLQDDNVGLMDEESEPEESDHGSVSDSSEEEDEKKDLSEEYDEYSSDNYSDSETEKPPKKKPPARKTVSSDESESDGDLFGEESKSEEDFEKSDEDDEETVKQAETSKGPSDFASELAKKIGAPVPKPADSDEEEEEEAPPKHKGRERKRTESSGSHKKRKHKTSKSKSKEDEDEDLFGTGIQEDEEDSPFGKSGGLFSGSKGLFDDDDDDDAESGGLFGDVDRREKEVEEKPKKKSKKPAGGVSLFGGKDDDSDDGLFSEKEKQPAKQKQPKSGGFFEDEDDEDDDYDDDNKMKESVPKTKATAKDQKPVQSLFDDDDDNDDDMFDSPITKSEEKEKKPKGPKLPAGAVPMFGKGPNPLIAAMKKQRHMSEDEDSDISDKSRRGSLKSNQSASSKSSLQKPVDRLKKEERSSSSNSLFDDDADDALFTSPPKPRADSKPKSKPVSALFDDDDDADEGGLFGMGKPAAKPSTQTKKLTTEKPRSGSLFDDEEEGDDLFGASKQPVDSGKKKPIGGVALFGGADILSKKKEEPSSAPQEEPPVKKTPEPAKTSTPKKQAALSLFDDEEDEEGDLFGGAGAKPPPVDTKKTKPAGTRDLFGDEDMLFGRAEDESPGVDLFGSSPAKSAPATSAAAPKSVTASKPPSKPPQKSGMGGGLFGEEEEDDLFGTPAVKQNMPKDKLDIAGATESESTDNDVKEEPAMEEPVKEEQPKPKKPVGGVSILGGIDPFAAMKQKKQETGDLEHKPRKDSLPKSDVTTKPRADSIPKPSKPFQSKKGAAVDSLFGDKNEEEDDDLFGGSKSAPAFKQPPPLTMDDDDDDDDLFNSKTKTKVNKPKPVSAKSNPVAEEEDDMFGSGPPKLPVSKGDNSLIDTEDKGDNLEVTNNEDLFGSPKETKPTPKPWKPAGAVSMFGGADPFSVIKKKEPEIIPKKEETVVKKEENTETEPEQKKRETPSVEDQPLSSPTKSKSKVGKLQFNLGINPAALLPGAAPPAKEPETVAVGFDQPAEVRTLHSAGKDRARIQSKRRPPSRQFRKSQIIEADDVPPLISPTGDGGISKPADLQTQPPPVMNDRVPQPTSDLFGNDDLLGTNVTRTTGIVNNVIGAKDDFADGLFSPGASRTKVRLTEYDEDDLFGDTSKLKSKVKPVEDSNDIFSSTSIKSKSKIAEKDDDIFSASSAGSKTQKPSAILNDEDDIFSPKPRSSSKTNKKSVINNDEDEDDIFATKPKSKQEPKADLDNDLFGATPTKNEALQEETNVKKAEKKDDPTPDDDIFADSPEKKATSKPKQNENEDDLFGKPSSTEKKKKLKRAQKTKDEVLFNDTTDIFADIPAAKPKEKKKKTAKPAGKSLFKDTSGLDDIFADVTPKPKTKKEKTKKNTTVTPTSTALNADDIFDDPLMK